MTLLFTHCGSPDDGFQDDIVGTWYTQGRRMTVEIYKQDKAYFGKITALKRPFDRQGNPKRDFRNPDPKKKDNMLIGTRILLELSYQGDKEWDGGDYYDVQSGELKDIEIKENTDGNLEVQLDDDEHVEIWRSEYPIGGRTTK